MSVLVRDFIVEEDKNMELNRYGMAVAGLLSVNHTKKNCQCKLIKQNMEIT